MVRRRETRLSFMQELGCQVVLSSVATLVLHLVWEIAWWPRAAIGGIMIGFGLWMLLVDVDWFRRADAPVAPDRSTPWTDWLR